MIGARRPLACTLYYSGHFETARQHACVGHSDLAIKNHTVPVEELTRPPSLLYAVKHYPVASRKDRLLPDDHRGSDLLAKELNDHARTNHRVMERRVLLGHFERNPAEVERHASDSIELSTRQNFATWLPGEVVLRGWARSAAGDTAEGIAWIENGIGDYRAIGETLCMPYYLALKAEALHLADRTSDAVEAIREALVMAERSEERWWCAELHRLHGVFLATTGAKETHIEASFHQCHQNCRGAEVGFARETGESILRRIPQAKNERVRRTWIPPTSLLTPKGKSPNLTVTFRINWHNFFGINWHISPPQKESSYLGDPKRSGPHVCQISPKECGQMAR